jgi:hypothetical protein
MGNLSAECDKWEILTWLVMAKDAPSATAGSVELVFSFSERKATPSPSTSPENPTRANPPLLFPPSDKKEMVSRVWAIREAVCVQWKSSVPFDRNFAPRTTYGISSTNVRFPDRGGGPFLTDPLPPLPIGSNRR